MPVLAMLFVLAMLVSFPVNICIIIRNSRKNKILLNIRTGKYLIKDDFEIKSPAILYGTPIEVALKNGFVYFIKDGKYFCVSIEDFASIKNKNSKFVFITYTAYITGTKVFAVKCDNTIFTSKLISMFKAFNNNEDWESKNEKTESNKNLTGFMTDSKIKKVKKAALILLAVGTIMAVLITVISLFLYKKIYFYDGYAFTGFLWTMCFALLGGGLITLALTMPSARSRFVIIGVCYIVFFVFFILLEEWLCYFFTTLLFMGGGIIYILFHHHDSEKENIRLTKTRILEKRAKNKMFYTQVMAIILAVALLLSFVIAFLPESNNSDDPDGIEGWTKCYKCSGSGYVRNSLGYSVRCPRCNGVGAFPDL